MPVAKANNVNLYYELNGERGDPMVLIIGSWSDHLNCAQVVPGLSESFHVLAYDRRGHSQSQKVAPQGSYDEDADDVAALMVQLSLAPAHVVGNSRDPQLPSNWPPNDQQSSEICQSTSLRYGNYCGTTPLPRRCWREPRFLGVLPELWSAAI